MSEIRSISEGSFVLGDTNNLTFEAGPGITVSQPSEGTVRIANDETVLFENSSIGYSASFTLSEPLSAFDRFRVYCRAISDGETFNSCMDQEPASGSYISYNGTYLIPNGYPVKYMIGYSSSNYLTYNMILSRREWTTPDGTSWACNVNPTDYAEKQKNGFIYKVVGINRKNGGNNE